MFITLLKWKRKMGKWKFGNYFRPKLHWKWVSISSILHLSMNLWQCGVFRLLGNMQNYSRNLNSRQNYADIYLSNGKLLWIEALVFNECQFHFQRSVEWEDIRIINPSNRRAFLLVNKITSLRGVLISLLRRCWLCEQICSLFDTQSGRTGWERLWAAKGEQTKL